MYIKKNLFLSIPDENKTEQELGTVSNKREARQRERGAPIFCTQQRKLGILGVFWRVERDKKQLLSRRQAAEEEAKTCRWIDKRR